MHENLRSNKGTENFESWNVALPQPDTFIPPKFLVLNKKDLSRLSEGFKTFTFTEPEMQGIAISVGANKVFDTFMELLTNLPKQVSLYLQSTHGILSKPFNEYHQANMPKSILLHECKKHRALLTDDEATGISVVAHFDASNTQGEICLDSNKTIFVYGQELIQLSSTSLAKMGIDEKSDLLLPYECPHEIKPGNPIKNLEEFGEFVRVVGALKV